MQTVDIDKNGQITIKSIRDFIIDNGLTENDTIVLNTLNFDDLVLEYRRTYNESIPIPFYFLRVLVTENSVDKARLDKPKIIKNDSQRKFQDYLPFSEREISFSDLPFDDKTIYRCGWCGNVVDADGNEFNDKTRQHKIEVLKKFGKQITQKDVDGKCCPNGHNE